MTISHSAIPFDAIAAGLAVRTTDDGTMLALDFLSTLTSNDRKRASQTLARIAARPETAGLLTLQRAANGRKHARKTISFSNAIQLLMVLPKRTASMQTRRQVAGVLADYLSEARTPCDGERHHLAIKQGLLELRQREAELQQQRRRLSLDRIRQCMELMERCGPLTEDDTSRFRRAIAEHMAEEEEGA
jgi:hypothetical protein